jgi:trigger factor
LRHIATLKREPTIMQITREELNPCTVKLSVVCDEKEVVEGFERAYKQIAKRVRVPGFRPGMAPKSIIEGMIQPEELYDAAADNIVRSVYKAAIQQEDLKPHSRPAIDLTTLDKDTSKCEFTIKVPLEPQVELGDYKGLVAKRPPTPVTDEEVEHQIEEMRRRKSTREAVTGRGVQEGDVAVVNIRVDGEEGDGRTFMTVAGQTFPQLDQALMGMEAEQMKSLDLTFPENFQEKDWAGKPLHSQVTLRSLNAVKLPELDDEFAQSYKVESVEDLKERLREQMTDSKLNMIREYVNEQLLEDLLSRSTVHVPDNMWESVAAQRMQDIAREQEERKLSLEEYAAQNGMTVQQLEEAQKNEAKIQVQRAVLVQRVFAAEKMTLTNTELNLELVMMAREFQMDPKALLNVLKKNEQIDELHFRATFRKVLQFLTENAEIAEVVEG